MVNEAGSRRLFCCNFYKIITLAGLAVSLFTSSATAGESITLTPYSIDSRHFVQGAHANSDELVRLQGGDLVITFTVSLDGLVELLLTGYDIDFADEVIIEGNNFSTFVKRGRNNEHTEVKTVSLGYLKAGTHQYTISNNYSAFWKWGVSDLMITTPNRGVSEGSTGESRISDREADNGEAIDVAQLSCAAEQIIKYDGQSWNCADDEVADVALEGIEGPQGIPGVNGERGADGMPGAPGRDGRQGPPGPRGADGAAGPIGPAGPAGEDGINADMAAELIELYARIEALESALRNVFEPVELDEQIASENDADGDGLTDEYENFIGTDINAMDSDGDGLHDGEEVIDFGTDPLLADSDGGGVDDLQELFDDTNPLDPSDDLLP